MVAVGTPGAPGTGSVAPLAVSTRADGGTGGRGGVAAAVPLSEPAGGIPTSGGVDPAVPLSEPAGGTPTDGGVAVAMPLVDPAGGMPTDGGVVLVRAEFAPGSVCGNRPGTVSNCCMMFTHGTPGLAVPGSAIAVAGLES
ncbi:hypothetical protein MDOR_21930 [Mycolicibacterium doricum]|uniref:Uncharacterized protein n=1 Tax=Mycolicibacterium doricum TaxID=126673 RepID=A0A1X1TKA2_9MYCO|nr:hypothetical protein [Mycolicibacterium doricum]ORV44970.1 hypothetical protein AWC01_02735 [Mycolicibacterium doricum]BBZ08024.1 hypothetical protein MDOR_21930 [Mycolicibacterium doricum]